ncbi:exodeoxyribonuclease VII large subunit [Methylophaga sp. 42_25_T18]|nr:exodeoxyribonuclease VII large subunit [Methylophaga sp. 42_25_T18]OUR89838.1 exodeoxyribonuclease VII large subunit [Methylophaga sp. 42_8_T64]
MSSLSSPDTNSTLATRRLKDVYAVSRLVREARSALEGSFPLVWVEGEISNLAMPASGHIYFTLKDEAAQVRCAMFRNRNRQLRFTPENGMQVLLRVRVTLYEGRGEFQLVVEHMEEAGSGALQRAYEALKYRLGQEGLFDQENKKSLPSMPSSIGIVSSPDGAAVHDIISVLNRRFPAVNIILYPVAVQGEGSAKKIAQAITTAEERQECDVLIIGRGGGSLEDLWSFNDEQLARTLSACKIPTISAVGHEVDFTIADFVADVRAPTPSAAAELAVPDSAELLNKVQGLGRRLTFLVSQQVQNKSRHLQHLFRRLPQPKTQINQQAQLITRLKQQLNRSWLRIVENKQQKLDLLTARLTHPQAKIDTQQQKVAGLKTRLQQAIKQQSQAVQQQQQNVLQLQKQLHNGMQQIITKNKTKLSQQMRTLAAVSPLNTLERGYSITTLATSGQVLQSSDDVELGQEINVRLQQGQLMCEVKEKKHD